jgi:hypothetical protein
VNPADVPCSDKDRKRKDDKRDARKLSIELAKGNLKGIYIPDKQMQDARSLVRQRHRSLKTPLQFAIEQYLQIRRILKEITLAIRDLSKQEPFIKRLIQDQTRCANQKNIL